MKALVHSYFYWPNMNMQLEEFGQNLSKCQQVLKPPLPENHIVFMANLESPWSRFHIDFAGPIKGQHCFILFDAYSK